MILHIFCHYNTERMLVKRALTEIVIMVFLMDDFNYFYMKFTLLRQYLRVNLGKLIYSTEVACTCHLALSASEYLHALDSECRTKQQT